MSATFRPELVPMWAKIAAWAVPAVALPSAVWRVGEAITMFTDGHVCGGVPAPLWEKVYVPSLSIVQMGFALLTVGLIRPWGEVFPRWLPVVGGRRVPVAVAVGAATAGAALLVAIMVAGLVVSGAGPAEPLPPGCSVPGWEVGPWYAPLVLWPPLLLAVAWHHLRRRRSQRQRSRRERSTNCSHVGR